MLIISQAGHTHFHTISVVRSGSAELFDVGASLLGLICKGHASKGKYRHRMMSIGPLDVRMPLLSLAGLPWIARRVSQLHVDATLSRGQRALHVEMQGRTRWRRKPAVLNGIAMMIVRREARAKRSAAKCAEASQTSVVMLCRTSAKDRHGYSSASLAHRIPQLVRVMAQRR